MPEPEKSVVENVGDFFGRWWTLATSKRVKAISDEKNLVSVHDDHPRPVPEPIKEEPLLLQNEISYIRQTVQRKYDNLTHRFKAVDRAVRSTQSNATKFNRYLQDEWTVLPKAAAITIGGLAGFVLGLKGSRFRRLAYSTTGLVTMAAFCYPNEAMDVIRTGIAHTRSSWDNFQKSPDPPSVKPVK